MPRPSVSYEPLPFFQPRYVADTSRLASIVSQGGRDLALLSQARGNNQAEGLMRLASILSGGFEGYRGDKAAAANAAAKAQEKEADRGFSAEQSRLDREMRAAERKAAEKLRADERAADKEAADARFEEQKRAAAVTENRLRDAAGVAAMDRAADNYRADQQLKEMLRHNRAAEAKQPRDFAKVVVDSPAGPLLLNRETGKTEAVIGPDGKPVGIVPTANERMDSRKFTKAAPVLSGIAELSERINTAQGLYAKMAGGAAKLKAKANLDDDVAEYDALVSMFTPMVSRALGHTGVLTEQDVQSVKNGFPRPGDSKSLRDRKMKRLMGIISDLESVEGVDNRGAGGGVERWERGPDGKPRKVGG